ncbi:DNA-binding domain-containing protein [Methylocapsa sp. D3K7]|uniref:HvfC/BufC N-terminal domain-containing protein n=1 Tax=Methylocapsa sp. D3K7 TaxID=3041435 RepID=UPI00244E688D|nr:DNA-binding domain-containing protein [Methylocapsa sp. D3K7]WGJ13993.1 DNA-binding domain-containing protein [Methylocapsa sp. D3K7]
MSGGYQDFFAQALRDPNAAVPRGVTAHNSAAPRKRFTVYRNNVAVGLTAALEARFPAVRKIVGEDFFKAVAKLFAAAHPPRSPLMMFYGDEFPAFLAAFEPARDLPYLADIARLEAARTRAYHAADAIPLDAEALHALPPQALPKLRFTLHPALEIVASDYPIVTIWAMNSGEVDLAPIKDWRGEDALVSRPQLDVEVRCLPPGAKTFLQSLAARQPLGMAAAVALAASVDFDLAVNLAALFSGLAIHVTNGDLP